MSPLVIRTPYGLGDSIYIRPVVKHAASIRPVFLDTPWPELFEDLPVEFVRAETSLRLQNRNLERQQSTRRWVSPPPGAPLQALYYTTEVVSAGVYEAMARNNPAPFPRWDLPDLGPSPIDTGGRPLALIRPVLRRHEWDNASRNPLPEYVDRIAGDLKARGFAVVAVADLAKEAEWLVSGRLPPCNLALTHGELSVRQLLAAARDAAIIVGGVGWIVPAAIALGTPAFVILGGCGAANAPDIVLDARMDSGRIGFAWPEKFCRCAAMQHQCSKAIPDLDRQWNRWRAKMAGKLIAV